MRTVTTLLATMALLLGLVPAAHAETGSFGDPSEDPATGVSAPFDIRRTGIINGEDALAFKVTIQRPRRQTRVFVRTQMNDEPGWILDALAWRTQHGKVTRLYLWPNTDDRNRVRCRGMKSSWKSGRKGHVRIRIPNSCIYGPRPWLGFRSGTYSGGGYPSHFIDDSRRDSLELAAG